jgi:predicted nucleic acid-binding protein
MKKVLIDTPVWSKFVRKKDRDRNKDVIAKVTELIVDERDVIIGPVRQEVLSGISDMKAFQNLKQKMSVFINEPIKDIDYELASEFSNICRRHGIQGSSTDFLECAMAARNDWEIFTEDDDFMLYKKYLPIKLFENK